MNVQNNQPAANEAKCCIDYCKTTFNVSGQEVVNNYKCNQSLFSSPDLWNIEKQKKKFAIRPGISVA